MPAKRGHPHEQPRELVPPPILGWSSKQYSRPATSLQWGVRPPSRSASEWSEAWSATIKENVKQPEHCQLNNDETTLFVVNPGTRTHAFPRARTHTHTHLRAPPHTTSGRFYLASCDITSPRFTRRGLGLSTKEFYAIVEPIKSPPPSREAMLIRRHGPTERRRGKYDPRTCQLGFGIVEVCPPLDLSHLSVVLLTLALLAKMRLRSTDARPVFPLIARACLCTRDVVMYSLQHAEKASDAKKIAETRAVAAAPGERERISLLDVNRKSLRSGPFTTFFLLHFGSRAVKSENSQILRCPDRALAS